MRQPLPQEEGFYLWYIHDMNYVDVGLVQVLQDSEKHLKYLAEKVYPTAYVYDCEFPDNLKELGFRPRRLTLYHQAHDHLPPADENNRPLVDGWIPFDFRWVSHYRRFEIEPIGMGKEMKTMDDAKMMELVKQAEEKTRQ